MLIEDRIFKRISDFRQRHQRAPMFIPLSRAEVGAMCLAKVRRSPFADIGDLVITSPLRRAIHIGVLPTDKLYYAYGIRVVQI